MRPVPAACTLPTAEQPLRVAEFTDLFAALLSGVERTSPTSDRALGRAAIRHCRIGIAASAIGLKAWTASNRARSATGPTSEFSDGRTPTSTAPSETAAATSSKVS